MRTTSYWLGSQDRWTPSAWADLQRAAADGLLDETSWVELKELVSHGKTANRELACDLASLALRSGLLVIGIQERAKSLAGDVVGVPLTGYRDRIDQVARDKIHPPLYVDIREIENPDQPGHGCLLVAVPATGPHMADDRYWGRGDTGKRALTDGEVRLYLTRRRTDREAVLAQVRELQPEYSSDEDDEPTPQLFVRAVPVDARPGCLRELTDAANGQSHFQGLASQVRRHRPDPQPTTPLQDASYWIPHARGRALYDRHPEAAVPGELGTQIVVEEDGALSLLYSHIYDRRPRNSIYWQPSEEPGPISIGTNLVLHTVNDLLGVAGLLGDGAAAYQGEWMVAVRVSELAGCYDYEQFHDFRHPMPIAFRGGSEYEEATLTTTVELVNEPWTVTARLLARLVRALGAAHRYLPYAPTPAAN